jgi:hypothetical protein
MATLALTALATGAFADVNNGLMHPHGGYIPWQGVGFAPFMGAGPTIAPQDQPIPVYNLAPAMGQAAFARAQYDNRWSDLQVMISRARNDFRLSGDYLAARDDYESAQSNYEAAVEAILSRVHADPQYKKLAERRTEEQSIVNSTAVGTGTRNVVAEQAMHDGSLITLMEAKALADDPTVTDARVRLVATHQVLSLKEKVFESQLYRQSDVAAARQQMESARAQLAGADGFLNGALISWNSAY